MCPHPIREIFRRLLSTFGVVNPEELEGGRAIFVSGDSGVVDDDGEEVVDKSDKSTFSVDKPACFRCESSSEVSFLCCWSLYVFTEAMH